MSFDVIDAFAELVYLAPSHQWEALVRAAATESPTKSAEMRGWSVAAQVGLLKWLGDVLQEHPNPVNEIELWRVRKDDRALRCLAVYLQTGIDLRLMEGADFRRTQLVRDAIKSAALSDAWKRKLLAVGWTPE